MIKLNIGCGPNMFPGWVNYDRQDMAWYLDILRDADASTWPAHQRALAAAVQAGTVTCAQHDLRDGFAAHPDGSVDVIYLGQVIEHLNPVYEAPKLIADCYRMLRSGGELRVTTPDLGLLIGAYQARTLDQFAAEQPDFYRAAPPGMQLSMLMFGACGPDCTWDNYEGHFCCYDQRSMTRLLVEGGFSQPVFHWGPDVPSFHGAIDMGMSHSFAAQTVKP